jgi:hypothetical protein
MAFSFVSPSSRPIYSLRNTATAAATTTQTFIIPQDADSIVAKFWTASDFTPQSTNAAQVTIQTSEDGGTTWRDVAAFTAQGVVLNQNAHFASIPCIGANGRGVANWIGSVAASTLALAATASVATGIASGLPMLGVVGRVQLTITGTLTTGGVNVDIYAPTAEMR